MTSKMPESVYCKITLGIEKPCIKSTAQYFGDQRLYVTFPCVVLPSQPPLCHAWTWHFKYKVFIIDGASFDISISHGLLYSRPMIA